MRKEVKFKRPVKFEGHLIVMVAYGLDYLPTSGYFLSLFEDHPTRKGEHKLVRDWDTRGGMSLSATPPVSLAQIVEKMKGFPEISSIDIAKVAANLPVGTPSSPQEEDQYAQDICDTADAMDIIEENIIKDLKAQSLPDPGPPEDDDIPF